MRGRPKTTALDVAAMRDLAARNLVSAHQSLLMLNEIARLRVALEQIASHDTGMRADFSVGARQAKIAREALSQ